MKYTAYYIVPLIILIFVFMGVVEYNHNKQHPCAHQSDGFPDGRAALGLEPIPCIIDR